METEIKIFGSLALALSAGALLGMSTPTEMKEAPEPAWRIAARELNAGKPIQLSQAPVVYSSMPEDLSTEIGYGSPGAYQAFYVNAPVRTGYTPVPDYRMKPLEDGSQAVISADAAVIAARDAQDRAAAAQPAPVKLAAAKTVDFAQVAASKPATSPEHDPVFDTGGDAPAMDADDVEE